MLGSALDFAFTLTLSTLIGGMIAFQVLFAPLIFIKLPSEVARPFIRKFFPFYYLYFGALSLVLFGLAVFVFNGIAAVYTLLALAIALGFVISRQVLMPLANKATDTGQVSAFKRYHMATVFINTVQLIALIVMLYTFLNQ